MEAWKKIALGVVAFSVIIGSVFGVLVQPEKPLSQIFSFTDQAVQTATPSSCGQIPQNYTDWLEINVLGNRTGINFQRVDVFGEGTDITLTIPLNLTAYAFFHPMNGSLEILYVPLPNYWSLGINLEVAVSYYITGYTPATQNLNPVPLLIGKVSC